MQSSRFRSWLVIQLYTYFTYYSLYKIIFKAFQGKNTRVWCTQELRRWSERIIKLLRIDYQVINPHQIEPQPGKPTLIMSNHTGFLNGPLSLNVFHNHPVRVLSTKIMANTPILGRAMKAAEFAFVNKKNRQKAIKDLENMIDLMNSGIVMWYAPEGRTSFSDQLLPFKKGGFIAAINSGATIIPMAIRGAHRVYRGKPYQNNLKGYLRRGRDLLSGGFTCTPLHMKQPIQVCIGQPIDASQYTLAEKELLMGRVFKTIQSLLVDVPIY